METKKKIEEAAYASDCAASELNEVVNLLDAITALCRPIDDGDATSAQMMDMWRMSDSILYGARKILTETADSLILTSNELMDAAKIGA